MMNEEEWAKQVEALLQNLVTEVETLGQNQALLFQAVATEVKILHQNCASLAQALIILKEVETGMVLN
jgi:hypothetical protein